MVYIVLVIVVLVIIRVVMIFHHQDDRLENENSRLSVLSKATPGSSHTFPTACLAEGSQGSHQGFALRVPRGAAPSPPRPGLRPP